MLMFMKKNSHPKDSFNFVKKRGRVGGCCRSSRIINQLTIADCSLLGKSASGMNFYNGSGRSPSGLKAFFHNFFIFFSTTICQYLSKKLELSIASMCKQFFKLKKTDSKVMSPRKKLYFYSTAALLMYLVFLMVCS